MSRPLPSPAPRTDAPRSYDRGGDRGERGGERGSRGFVPRREKVDPWFLKPYEPSSAPRQEPAPAQASSQAKPKQKLAALLGGLPKQ